MLSCKVLYSIPGKSFSPSSFYLSGTLSSWWRTATSHFHPCVQFSIPALRTIFSWSPIQGCAWEWTPREARVVQRLFFPVLNWRLFFRELLGGSRHIKKTEESQAGWFMSLLAPPMLDKCLGTCSTLLSPAPGLGSVHAGGVWETLALPALHQLLLDSLPICDPYVQLDASHNTNSSSQVLAVPIWSPAWGLKANNHPVQGLRVTAILWCDGLGFSVPSTPWHP